MFDLFDFIMAWAAAIMLISLMGGHLYYFSEEYDNDPIMAITCLGIFPFFGIKGLVLLVRNIKLKKLKEEFDNHDL